MPRVVPRQEQAIRARKAEAAGLVTCLPIDDYPNVDRMIEAIAELPERAPPSAAGFDELLDGLESINSRVEKILRGRNKSPRWTKPGNRLSLVR